MKVLTVVGTRPEIIRLARVIDRLDQTEGIDHVLVHTGQNYDYSLNQIFFDDLDLRAPDHYLGVDTSSLGAVLGGVLVQIEKVLLAERPDAMLVLGDTNSCISTVMAKRMRIPTYHMEAGNRCFDENVPEETNRRLVDHVADFNLAYTEHARRNLLAEGLQPRRILVTGSPMREVLEHFRHRIDASTILDQLGLEAGQYFLVSAHREENVDSPDRLGMLLKCLTSVHEQYDLPVIVSTHPRTRKRLDALGVDALGDIRWLEPFGFHDFNRLQHDLGGILDPGLPGRDAARLDRAPRSTRHRVDHHDGSRPRRRCSGDRADLECRSHERCSRRLRGRRCEHTRGPLHCVDREPTP
jgi:UDP-N-acetyl-L-fucosamine synthase